MYPGDPAIAEISGEMDIASAAWLRDGLLLAIRRHGPAICVDLHGVTFLDCSGIGVLLATARRARLEGGWMRVVRPSATAWHVITLLGLQHVLTRDHEHQ
jgi:anti-anti-sigma factor